MFGIIEIMKRRTKQGTPIEIVLFQTQLVSVILFSMRLQYRKSIVIQLGAQSLKEGGFTKRILRLT